MRFHTIESTYEFRMIGILQQLLKNFETDSQDFQDEDDLGLFLWENREELGILLATDLAEYKGDWLTELQSREE